MTNLVFVCLFTVEMLVKMYAIGFQVSEINFLWDKNEFYPIIYG